MTTVMIAAFFDTNEADDILRYCYEKNVEVRDAIRTFVLDGIHK